MSKLQKRDNIVYVGSNLYKDAVLYGYLERIYPYIKDSTNILKFPTFTEEMINKVINKTKELNSPLIMFVLDSYYDSVIKSLNSKKYKYIDKEDNLIYEIDNNFLIVKNISLFGKLPKPTHVSEKNISEFKVFGKESKLKELENKLKEHAVVKKVLPTWFNIEIKDAEGEQILTEASKILDIKILPVRSIRGAIINYLSSKNKTLSFAESCTGGLLASKFTAVAGVSKVLNGSMVTYSNKIKQEWLGVKEETLNKFGAVSKECIEEMLVGIRDKSGADISVAISGIAGPDGGTDEKPVGTVYIGIINNDKVKIKKYLFNGDRGYIQEQAARSAIEMILKSEPEFFEFF